MNWPIVFGKLDSFAECDWSIWNSMLRFWTTNLKFTVWTAAICNYWFVVVFAITRWQLSFALGQLHLIHNYRGFQVACQNESTKCRVHLPLIRYLTPTSELWYMTNLISRSQGKWILHLKACYSCPIEFVSIWYFYLLRMKPVLSVLHNHQVSIHAMGAQMEGENGQSLMW